MQYRINKKIVRILTILILPYLFTILTIKLTPTSFNIQFEYKCENQIDGASQCHKLRSGSFYSSFRVVEEKVNIIKRLSVFSRLSPNLISFKMNAVNNSHAALEVSSPLQKIESGIDVICNFDRSIFLRKYSMEELLAFIENFAEKVEKCQLPVPITVGDQEFIWGQGAWLTIKISEEYGLEFRPDIWSYCILYFIYFLILLAALPLIKQTIRFVVRGNKYFSE